ncbi:MAG: hypothetical protein ABSG03_29720 [Bryobacteraceae bacterium]
MMRALQDYDWPGNIERAVIVTTGSELRSLAAELRRHDAIPCAARTRTGAKRLHITSTLQETNWVVGGCNGAASRLGLPRTTLISKMRKLEISKDGITHGNPVESGGLEVFESDPAVLGASSISGVLTA